MSMIIAAAEHMTLSLLTTLADCVAASSTPSATARSSPRAACDRGLARSNPDGLVSGCRRDHSNSAVNWTDIPAPFHRVAELLPTALLVMLLAVPHPHPLIYVGIAETSETASDDAPALTPERKTHGPVTDGDG